ncbi:MAG TPA: asparagine--tRNA ligase, partial [Verrucomicrobiota bacterium]|nr:asparagine--tRNA ligase [Verrucomicrobiota bacterium]
MRTLIKYLVNSNSPIESVVVNGWVRTRRDSKAFSFLEVNDGSCLTNLQVMADANTVGYKDISPTASQILIKHV